jgi:large subunit ribosomal protein L4
MELVVKNIGGKDTKKKVSLDKSIYEIEPNDHAIYLDVKQYLANQRQGTHKAKERGEVAGSTRKIKKQKGTGTARAGDIKNPLFKGGGRVFGPKPRNYSFKLNTKQKQLARKSALSYKAKEGVITVLEDFTFDAPQTKKYTELLSNLGALDKKSLLVLSESNKNVYLSSRNLKGAKIVTASEHFS